MKKFIACLCMVMCLAGCSTPSEQVSTADNSTLITEVQGKLEALHTKLNQDGALESIRRTIQEGTPDESVLEFYFEDMILPTPSLSADMLPQKDTLRVGYNWQDETYTCLFTVTSDKSYAYIVAKFDRDLVCFSFRASSIIDYPYLNTPSGDAEVEDYIPRPIITEEGTR